MRVLAREVSQYDNKLIEVCGWVHRRRELGSVMFLILRDRSGMVQIVCNRAEQVAVESVVRVKGRVAKNERSIGGYELLVNEYISLDVEMGYIKDEHDLMDLEVNILKSIFAGINEQCKSILDEKVLHYSLEIENVFVPSDNNSYDNSYD